MRKRKQNLEHKVGAKMKYPASTMDAKRWPKQVLELTILRPFYQKILHTKIFQFAPNEWPKDEEKKNGTKLQCKQSKIKAEWCCQNTNVREIDGRFKALVDGQNLEHQLWHFGGTTHKYLDVQRAPKQQPKAVK